MHQPKPSGVKHMEPVKQGYSNIIPKGPKTYFRPVKGQHIIFGQSIQFKFSIFIYRQFIARYVKAVYESFKFNRTLS